MSEWFEKVISPVLRASALLLGAALLLTSISSGQAQAAAVNNAQPDIAIATGIQQTHDNGNYHRYHHNRHDYHYQRPRQQRPRHRHHRHRYSNGGHANGWRPGYYSRHRHGHRHRHHYDRRIIGAIIGGAIGYHLLH